MPDDLNPLEEMVIELSDIYVAIVKELVNEFAPFRPWWSAQLTPDQQLFRYLEIRRPIITWLVEAGIYMGYQTFDELLKNLDKFWFGNLLIDMVPPEIIDLIPIQLMELVQADPSSAGDHIRKMEKLVARRIELQAKPPPEESVPLEPLGQPTGYLPDVAYSQ